MNNDFITVPCKITFDREEFELLMSQFERLKGKFDFELTLEHLIGSYVIQQIYKMKGE